VAGLSGDGLSGAARDGLGSRVFRLEVADSHITGDLMDLIATGHSVEAHKIERLGLFRAKEFLPHREYSRTAIGASL
jgi:hypothetical protein